MGGSTVKFEDVKKWLPMLLIGLPFALLGAYLVVWMDRVGCQDEAYLACWIAAAANRGADFIWFDWVKRYQELTGGIATLIGAAAAILAVLLQRSWQRAAVFEAKRDSRLQIINWAVILLKGTAEFAQRQQPETVEAYLQALREMLPSIAGISHGLADNVRIAVTYMEDYTRDEARWPVRLEDGTEANLTGLEWVAVYAMLWAGFFDVGGRLIRPDGSFQFVRQSKELANRWRVVVPNVDIQHLPIVNQHFDI
jgi:hypothetical protein